MSVLGSAMIVFFLYVLFHEFGHTLVAISCGAKITKFSIISARMSYTGGDFNQFTISLLHAAGMILPSLVYLAFILTFKLNKKSIFYLCFSIMVSVMTISSVFAWIIVPIVSMFDVLPAGDDVAKFLVISQLDPFIVILCAAALITVMIIIAVSKGVFKSFFVLRDRLSEKRGNHSV